MRNLSKNSTKIYFLQQCCTFFETRLHLPVFATWLHIICNNDAIFRFCNMVAFFNFATMRQPGDIIWLEATGCFSPGIECIVMEVHPDDGRVTKMKAVVPDERLARIGFIEEGGDYVAVEWQYFPN